MKLTPIQQYIGAWFLALLGLVPLWVASAYKYELPLWAMIICMVWAMSGAGLAYAIRIRNT